MTFEAIPDLLADMIEEQKKTREAVIQLAEALAGVRAKVEAGKAIDKAKTEPVQATVTNNGASNTPAQSSPPAEVAAQAPAPVAAPTAPVAASVTYQDAATAITKLSRAKGRDAAVALLAKFGAAKLPDVKPEQFADVIAAANEAMGV